jgi:hypothetical protein
LISLRAALLLMIVLLPGISPAFTYTAPIDGPGDEEQGYWPRCLGLPGYASIDLRPFIGVDRHLCSSDVLPADMTGVEVLGDRLDDDMTAERRTKLETLGKKALAGRTVTDTIANLLRDKLRAGRNGKLEIWLGGKVPIYQRTAWVNFEDGGLVADLANAAARSILWAMLTPNTVWAASHGPDTFTGADAGVLAGDLTWTEVTATQWTRTGNRAEAAGTTSSTAEARAEHDTSTDDFEVSADMTYTYGSGGQLRCAVMGRKDSSTTRTYYQFGAQRNTGENVYRLISRSAGSVTTLGDSAGATSTTFTPKLRMDGTSISGFINGALVVGPVTDATTSGNTRGGMTYTGGSGDVCTADNVVIADYTASAGNGAMQRRNH